MVMDFFATNRIGELWLAAEPVLPEGSLRLLCVRGLWALLAASAVFQLSGGRLQGWRAKLAALMALLCLLPGPISPAYWLEMAFAAPSWSTALLCMWHLLTAKPKPSGDINCRDTQNSVKIPLAWALAGVALGWLLTLDTFAALPLNDSVYAWGFGPVCSALLLAVAASLCLVTASAFRIVPLLALGLFILTRLPSGNIWDALLDPWLWLYLHLSIAMQLWKRLRKHS